MTGSAIRTTVQQGPGGAAHHIPSVLTVHPVSYHCPRSNPPSQCQCAHSMISGRGSSYPSATQELNQYPQRTRHVVHIGWMPFSETVKGCVAPWGSMNLKKKKKKKKRAVGLTMAELRKDGWSVTYAGAVSYRLECRSTGARGGGGGGGGGGGEAG